MVRSRSLIPAFSSSASAAAASVMLARSAVIWSLRCWRVVGFVVVVAVAFAFLRVTAFVLLRAIVVSSSYVRLRRRALLHLPQDSRKLVLCPRLIGPRPLQARLCLSRRRMLHPAQPACRQVLL